jgi:hypothetical protein
MKHFVRPDTIEIFLTAREKQPFHMRDTNELEYYCPGMKFSRVEVCSPSIVRPRPTFMDSKKRGAL